MRFLPLITGNGVLVVGEGLLYVIVVLYGVRVVDVVKAVVVVGGSVNLLGGGSVYMRGGGSVNLGG